MQVDSVLHDLPRKLREDLTLSVFRKPATTYELLVGIPPFYDKNQHKMFHKIKFEKIPIPKSDVLSQDALSFINQLLVKDRYKRLGAKGDASQVLSHPFLKDIVLKDINDKKIIPEYIPKKSMVDNLLDGFDEEKEEMQESVVPFHLKSLIQANQKEFEKHGFKSDRKEKSFKDFRDF